MYLDDWALQRVEEVVLHLLPFLGLSKENKSDVLPEVLAANIGKLHELHKESVIKHVDVKKTPREEAREAILSELQFGGDAMALVIILADRRLKWWIEELTEHLGRLHIAEEQATPGTEELNTFVLTIPDEDFIGKGKVA